MLVAAGRMLIPIQPRTTRNYDEELLLLLRGTIIIDFSCSYEFGGHDDKLEYIYYT